LQLVFIPSCTLAQFIPPRKLFVCLLPSKHLWFRALCGVHWGCSRCRAI